MVVACLFSDSKFVPHVSLGQVLAPLQGGIPQQTGVIIQPQQIVLAGNKVQQNAQVRFKNMSICFTNGGQFLKFFLGMCMFTARVM